jgi:hypothetical protein
MLIIRNEHGQILGNITEFKVEAQLGVPITQVSFVDGTKRSFVNCFGDITVRSQDII